MTPKTLTLASIIVLGLAALATAAVNQVRQTTTGDMRCIASNGIPDHDVGQFPNRGNPHAISAQDIELCVILTPEKGEVAREVRVTGIAKNGILIRPGTADYYDASSPRGHSRDRSSGWNLEAMGAGTLGLDAQNAHVDRRGLYHYHGVAPALAEAEGTLIGYAADGFQIHYAGASAVSSYMLKPGVRATAPGGPHDGTYVEDWQYVVGLGNLDECNGATVNGQYMYFATDTYPFYPRCLFGTEVTRIR